MGSDSPTITPPERDRAANKPAPAPRKLPTKPLPTRRVAFAKQVEILRAYSAICGGTARPVANAELAVAVGLAADTIAYANPFFVSIELLDRYEAGVGVPRPELVAYHMAHQWDAESAFKKLAPVFKKAWFADVLMPTLRFRPMTEDEAVTKLAEASAATPDYKFQLKLTLDYLEAAGIIVRDNGSIKLTQNGSPSPTEESRMDVQKAPASTTVNGPGDGARAEAPPANISTAFAKTGGGGAGALDLNVNIHVDMAEMATWSPARITAFMAGLAAVLAAKGQMEKEEAERK